MTETEWYYGNFSMRGDSLRVWHLAMVFGSLAVSGTLFLLPTLGVVWPATAILIQVIPGLLGMRFLRDTRIGAVPLVTMSWALSTAVGAALTGGVSSPLFMLTLLPVITGWMGGKQKTLALGAAGSILAASVAALSAPLGFSGPVAPIGWHLGLGLMSLSVLGTAIILAARINQVFHERKTAQIETECGYLERVLNSHPDTFLTISPAGRVSGVFGARAGELDLQVLRTTGLPALMSEPSRDVYEGWLANAPAGQTLRCALINPLAWQVELRKAKLERDQMLIIMHDVSDAARRESDLTTERDAANSVSSNRSRFLANMSHELRTPLNAIMGFSDVMRQEIFGPMPKRYAEYAGLIHDSGAHLLDMVGDVLDVSKIEADRYELNLDNFDAREAISSALRILRLQAEQSDIKMRGLLPTEDLEVLADRRALRQIVLNLVSNALKFTGSGGSVTVELNVDEGQMELAVVDTGVGIAPEDLVRVGQPYQQVGDRDRRRQGTGLGLSLVRSLAEMHGGTLSIDSVLGEGTTVTVRMPVLAHPETYSSGPSSEWGDNVVAFSPYR